MANPGTSLNAVAYNATGNFTGSTVDFGSVQAVIATVITSALTGTRSVTVELQVSQDNVNWALADSVSLEGTSTRIARARVPARYARAVLALVSDTITAGTITATVAGASS